MVIFIKKIIRITLGYGECNSFGFQGLITPESKQYGKTQTGGCSKKDVFPRNKIKHVRGKLLVTTCKLM